MAHPGEVDIPPPESPVTAEVLRLHDLHGHNMPEEAVLDIALNHASNEADPGNTLFLDDPALWRAFALLEQLRIIPNVQELNAYQETLLKSGRTGNYVLETLIHIDAVRDKANDIASDLTMSYLSLISDDEKVVEQITRKAELALKKHAQTNVVRVLEAIEQLNLIKLNEMILLRRTLGGIL